jgi:hypothetical protein
MRAWQWISSGVTIKDLIGVAVLSVSRVYRFVHWWVTYGPSRVAFLAMAVVLMNRLTIESGGSPSVKSRVMVIGLIPVLWLADGTMALKHRWRHHGR